MTTGGSQPSPPVRTMKSAISATPRFSLRLVKMKGRSPRILRASRSMTARSAPTRGARAGQELSILLGVDAIGHHGDVIAFAHLLAEAIDQRRLTGADRPADADAKRSVGRGVHERKSLVYWVSCRMEHQSMSGAALP